jgi:predicted  nucleic acid-binding Zn-ribbon protein
VKSELSNLIELQKTDTRLRQLKGNIESATTRRAELQEQFEQHASSIREIQNRLAGAKDKKADLERQIIEAKTSHERADRNLKTAQDQKQYEAAMREIDSLDRQISKFETEVLEQLEIIDEVNGVLEERKDEIANLESDWEKTVAEFEASLAAEEKELKKLGAAREDVLSRLPARLAAVYDRLVSRSRDGIAVAEVIDGSCSACFMSLRKQIVVELRTTNDIITCESCTRILYVSEGESQEATATS